MVKISDLNLNVAEPIQPTQTLDPATSLPKEDIRTPMSSLKLRGVSGPKIGKYAGLGLMDLTSSAGTDFTITGATRHGNKDSHHGTGNAIDFGVQYGNGDGRDLISYFFDNEEGTNLSQRGADFLRKHNAELIDERSRDGQAHFHLEFNNPETAKTIYGPKDDQPFYEKGAVTSEEGFPIYGVQDSYKNNDYNSTEGYSKAYDDLVDEDGMMEIGPQSQFFLNYGTTYEEAISESPIVEQPTAEQPDNKPLNTFSNFETVEGKDFGRYIDNPYQHYSNERVPFVLRGNLLGANRDTVEGYYPLFKNRSEASIRREARSGLSLFGDYGIDIHPGTNIKEETALKQTNANKFIRSFGNMSSSFLEVSASTVNTILLGAPSAWAQGRFSGVFNNPGNEILSNFKNWYKQEYPIHASKSEEEMSLLQSIGTANFWADQGMDGVGFLLGAAVTGGVAAELKVATKLSKMMGIANPKNYARAASAMFRKSTVSGGFQLARRVVQGSGTTSARLAKANFIGAGLISAAGEASIEANMILKNSIDLISKMQAEGDPRYQGMSEKDIRDTAEAYANIAWGLNVVTVGASNLVMFKNLFGGGSTNLFSKYLKSRLVTQGGKTTFKELGKAGWVREWAKNWWKRPLAEMNEEWIQYALERGAKDYFTHEYTPDLENVRDYIDSGVGMGVSMAKGWWQTPQELHGQQAMFLGALLGKLGEAGGSYFRGAPTEWKSYQEKYERTKAVADELNAVQENGDVYKHILHLANLTKSEERQRQALEKNDTFKLKTDEAFKIFKTIELFEETGQIDVLLDLLDDVAKMSNEEYAETFERDQTNPNDPLGLPVTKVDVNKEVDFLRQRIKDYQDNLAPIKEGIAAMMPQIARKLSNDPNVDAQTLSLIQQKLAYYSYMSKDFDRRTDEINTALLDLTAGIINMEGFKGIELTKKDLNDSKVLQEVFSKFVEQLEQMSEAEINLNDLEMQQLFDLFADGLVMARELQSFQEMIEGIYNNPAKEFQKAKEDLDKREEAKNQAEEKIASIVESGQASENATQDENNKESNETPATEKQSKEQPKPQKVQRNLKDDYISREDLEKDLEIDGVTPKFGEFRDNKTYEEEVFVEDEETGELVPVKRNRVKAAASKTRTKSVKINGKTFQIQIELYDDGTATYRVNSTKVKAGVVNVDKSLSEADLEAELEASLKKESPTPNQPNPAESSQTTNEATERDPEVPSNETSINENEESQVTISKEDDSLQAGIEKDEPVKLASILTAAWKSVRNFFNNTPGIDPITSNYLENPDTGNITQQDKDIVWEIDFNYIELREGGQYPRGTVNKLKNKKDLTDEELKVVPIKGTLLTKEGTTLTFYMHEEPYIFTNMDPKKWKQAIEELSTFRRDFYNLYQKDKIATAKVVSMSGGHLDTRRGQKNNLATVLNNGDPRVRDKRVVFVFNDGSEYVDSFGRTYPELSLNTTNPNTKGAVYMPIQMNNGDIFPLRVSIENLNRPAAELLYTIYTDRMSKKILLNDVMSEAWISDYIKTHDFGDQIFFMKKLFDYVSNSKLTPTFSEVLNMLVYEHEQVTKMHAFRFDVKNNLLKLGNEVDGIITTESYSMQDIESNKEKIIDWFVENKRFNVQRSRTSDPNYVNLFVENKIVHTNAFTHRQTGTPFIQPSVRMSVINSPSEYAKEVKEEKPPLLVLESVEEGEVGDIIMESVKDELIKNEIAKSEESAAADEVVTDLNSTMSVEETEAQLNAAMLASLVEEKVTPETEEKAVEEKIKRETLPPQNNSEPAWMLDMEALDDLDDIDGGIDTSNLEDDDQTPCK